MVTARGFIKKPTHKIPMTWCKTWLYFNPPNFWIANHFIDRTVNIHHIPDHCTIFKNLTLKKQKHTKEHQKRLCKNKFTFEHNWLICSKAHKTLLWLHVSGHSLGWPATMKSNTDMELVSTLYLYFLSDTSNCKVVKIAVKLNAVKSKQNNIKRETEVW